MKKIISFFKNRIVISVLGLMAISILVWFIGPQLKFGEDNSAPLESVVARLIAIIILVVIWGLNNLRQQFQNKKHNEDLVEDLEKNHKQNAQNEITDQSSQELSQIGQRFSEALATLKKTQFKGKSSSKALYELPWYIIIGPPGSGKTTALVNSTLDFPLAEKFGKGALQGVGGTRNCDWWFTNDAVLVDTAGRYTTQDSHRAVDSSAWEGFLSLLKRNRTRRPINGAIVAISLQDLLIQSEEERIAHAKTIRSRIDELMEKLEIRFPIYLMFTKSDLVSGFTEFFEDLSKEEREQVWGVSLPNAAKASDNPDFDFFDDEYQSLLQRLYDRVLWRVHQERDVNRRGVIEGFPQQMENLQSIVSSFVRQTFAKNRYQYQPYLRGVYFSSGTQDGTPIDRLMTSVASNFGFSRDVAHRGGQQGKSYFLGNLFKQVIFPESELVGSNRRYEKFIYWGRKAGFAGIAAAFVGFISVWAGSLTQHKSYMSEVQEHVAEFNAESKRVNKRSSDLRITLPSLNPLLQASKVYDKEEHPWLSSLGLYDGNVDSTADEAYQQKLKTILLPRVIKYLAGYLSQGHRGGDLYNTFRVYLMFEKLERMDTQIISDWFNENLSERLYGEATQRKQLLVHLDNLLKLELEPTELNTSLVNNTRQLLLRVPVSQRIYGRIRTSAEYSESIDLLNYFGESVRDTFKVDTEISRQLQIPWMFTLEGYNNIDLSPESDVISGIMQDRWVLSEDNKAKTDFVEEDLDEISEQVKDHYLSEYLDTWKKVFKALNVVEFRDMRHATEVLAVMTDPVYSPLVAILQVSKENTELMPPLPDAVPNSKATKKVGKKTKQAAGLLANKLNSNRGTKVDKQFQNLNALSRESAQRAAPINAAIQNIQQLHDFIDGIMLAPDPSKQAFEISKARFQNNVGNAITQIDSYGKKLPDPVKSWFVDLADQSWKVVIQSGRRYLDSEWRNQVYSAYSRGLANGYPLNRNAKDELAIIDFSEFFKSQGTLDKFEKQFITPFINKRSWENKVVSGRHMSLSPQLLSQLQKANMIRQVFFKANPAVPSISFQLKPDNMSKNTARFTLELGRQKLTYNHGPKFWKNMSWSGEDENQRVRILFEDLKGENHSKVYNGPWAWFKLQDSARLRKTSVTKMYKMNFSVADKLTTSSGRSMTVDHKIDYLVKAKSVNNPFSKNLLGTFRCPESI